MKGSYSPTGLCHPEALAKHLLRVANYSGDVEWLYCEQVHLWPNASEIEAAREELARLRRVLLFDEALQERIQSERCTKQDYELLGVEPW